jgi:hypothetical protein
MASELTSDAALDQIKEAILGYYKALDDRKHGRLAQNRAFNQIQRILGMRWVQGASKLPLGDKSRPHCMVIDPNVDPSYLVNIDGLIRYQEKRPEDDPRNSMWNIKLKS